MRKPLVVSALCLTVVLACQGNPTAPELPLAGSASPPYEAHSLGRLRLSSELLSLGPVDVSVLFPASPDLWPADLPTASGPLLPKPRFELNARSLTQELDDADEYAALRVVGMRFDPCFQRALGGPCEPQIRLVFQAATQGARFFDGAVHALYALTPAAFEDAVTQLAQLVDTPSSVPLGVHPRLSLEGVAGTFGQGLKAIAQAHLGPATLTRVTFMTRTTSTAGQWQFSGFEILENQDKPAKLPIAGIGATMQNVTRNRPDADHVFDYTVHPLFAEKVGRRGASGRYLAELPLAARLEVHDWATRQESPAAHLPDTTDCASCHLANHIGRHLEALTPELTRSPHPKIIASNEKDANNLRAFGYFDTEPQVAQRTANETAAVLQRLARPRSAWFTP